jgi:hypothetical protein
MPPTRPTGIRIQKMAAMPKISEAMPMCRNGLPV